MRNSFATLAIILLFLTLFLSCKRDGKPTEITDTNSIDKPGSGELTAPSDPESKTPGTIPVEVLEVMLEKVPDSVSNYFNQLQDRVAELERENETLRGKALQAVEVDPRVQRLVNGLLQEWEDLRESGTPEKLLGHFATQFHINFVNVDTNFVPKIITADPRTFNRRLKALIRQGEFDLDFGSPTYLYFNQRGEIFTVSFTIATEVFGENGRSYTSENFISLAGRVEDEAKIADYYWVDMANPD